MSDTDIQGRIDTLAEVLSRHEAALAAGQRIDLSNLDQQMGALCVELVNNRPESNAHVPALQALVRQLDQLAAELAKQNGSVS